MDIDLIKRSIRLDRQRLQDTSSDLLIQKTLAKQQWLEDHERLKKGLIKILWNWKMN
nr:MAG TPA: hypothetical protein [Caudoviricetes sp.]